MPLSSFVATRGGAALGAALGAGPVMRPRRRREVGSCADDARALTLSREPIDAPSLSLLGGLSRLRCEPSFAAIAPRAFAAPPSAGGPTTPGAPDAPRASPPPALPSCRFCFEEGDDPGDAAGGRLVQPCACSGTQAFVHVRCLRAWQRRRTDGEETCPVCRRAYAYAAPPRPFLERAVERCLAALRARAQHVALLAASLAVDVLRDPTRDRETSRAFAFPTRDQRSDVSDPGDSFDRSASRPLGPLGLLGPLGPLGFGIDRSPGTRAPAGSLAFFSLARVVRPLGSALRGCVLAETLRRGGAVAVVAAFACFALDCERAYRAARRFHREGGGWRDALRAVALRRVVARELRGALIRWVEARDVRVGPLGDATGSGFDPAVVPLWAAVFFAHDVVEHPHLVLLCAAVAKFARATGDSDRSWGAPTESGGSKTNAVSALMAAAAQRVRASAAKALEGSDPGALGGGIWDAPWLGEFAGRW